MLENDYYIRKLQAITKIIVANKSEDINLPFRIEVETLPVSVLGIQEYFQEKYSYQRLSVLFTDKKYFIRLNGSSLETILTAFTKEVFFVGFQNKEVITHDSILLPLDYIYHDRIHYTLLNLQYEIVNKEKLEDFLNFIKGRQYSYHVYLIIYLFIFESRCYDYDTVENYKNKIQEFDEYFKYNFHRYVCAFLRFNVSKEDFTLIINKLEEYYKQKNLFAIYSLYDLMNEHFLMGLLPKDIQNKMSQQKEEVKKQLVLDYFYTCMWTFLGYYRDFMFRGSIPASMRKQIPPTPATQSASPTQSLAEATEEN